MNTAGQSEGCVRGKQKMQGKEPEERRNKDGKNSGIRV
jgi:hypothetical protein